MNTSAVATSTMASDSAEPMPPGYKLTEIGVFPEDWSVVELGHIASICTGNTPPTQATDNYGDEFLFVSPADLGEDAYITDTEKKLSAKGFALSRHFPKGSILFTCIGSTIGKCAIASVELTSNQQINALLPSPRYCTQFVYYTLCRAAPWIKSQAGEQAVPIVNKSQFSEARIPFPLLPEQRAIAAALSDVDELIGALDKLIAKKRAIKLATMQQLLTGKARLPGFSGEWCHATLGEFASIRNVKVMPRQVDPETPYVELEHIGQGDGRLLGCSTADSSTSSKYRFQRGDVLFGRLRSYLRKYWHADRDGICTTEIWPLMVDAKRANSGFLRALVETDAFIDAASISYGTHMPRADWGVMRNFDVSLPPLPEQEAIASVLKDMDAEITALEQRRDKTKAIKQGMMQSLLAGRVRLVEPEIVT